MRTTAILSVMALALLFTPALFAQDEAKPAKDEAKPAADEAEGVQWIQDYAKALEKAKADKKRLFIEFTATW
jgi:hypothetical protein